MGLSIGLDHLVATWHNICLSLIGPYEGDAWVHNLSEFVLTKTVCIRELCSCTARSPFISFWGDMDCKGRFYYNKTRGKRQG